MAETKNIGDIAEKISKDIFKHFLWNTHPKRDDNFTCSNEEHKSKGGKPKKTHPGDVVFYYSDPYLGKNIYLHTDLKSYAADSITTTKLREAFKSLCMTVECAKESPHWREKYSIEDSEQHDVRGMLFVHNYDESYEGCFDETINRVNLSSLPVAPGSVLHFLGPHDIQRLYTITNDMIRLKGEDELPKDYSFYYPDLVMIRRQGDVWQQPATIESLVGPYLIIKHHKAENAQAGYLIYYNRPGNSPEEFVYFLDTLSRYQMLESEQKIRIRVTDSSVIDDLKSVFETAKKKYAKVWGFDPVREQILNTIEIDRVTSVTNTYNPGDMGWRNE